MKKVDWINMLKLRTSYGLTGNDNFDDYVWIAKLKQAKIAFGNNLTTSYYPSNITNPDLKWERTQQFNVGLDWGILKSRWLAVGCASSCGDRFFFHIYEYREVGK